ncbi:MAG TPA: hypothetical protein DCR20_08585, partial [Planctomycetaceae bacterium]|nr:hypothetical protein [Planctomycetaceae bacterium]
MRCDPKQNEESPMRYMTLLALLATLVVASPAEAGRSRTARKACCTAAAPAPAPAAEAKPCCEAKPC